MNNKTTYSFRYSRAAILGLLAAVSLAVTALPQAAEAQRFQLRQSLSPDNVRAARSQRTISLSSAVRIVRQRYDVRELLNAYTQSDRNGNPSVHVVRIITNEGRRIDVHVDAVSGRIRRG